MARLLHLQRLNPGPGSQYPVYKGTLEQQAVDMIKYHECYKGLGTQKRKKTLASIPSSWTVLMLPLGVISRIKYGGIYCHSIAVKPRPSPFPAFYPQCILSEYQIKRKQPAPSTEGVTPVFVPSRRVEAATTTVSPIDLALSVDSTRNSSLISVQVVS